MFGVAQPWCRGQNERKKQGRETDLYVPFAITAVAVFAATTAVVLLIFVVVVVVVHVMVLLFDICADVESLVQ